MNSFSNSKHMLRHIFPDGGYVVAQNSLEPEDPRASNTDDVECFFQLRDHVGPNFHLETNSVCMEVLHHSELGLTYPALVDTQKQSVEDAERLFSCPLCHHC